MQQQKQQSKMQNDEIDAADSYEAGAASDASSSSGSSEITPEDGESRQEAEHARWYTDTILQSQLADYSSVRGCMVIRPYGYALWENIQQALDGMIKETGHENAYFPLFIPESFLKKEAQHVEGFAPECAVVTHGGGKKLDEPLIVRPTSETIINHTFAKWIQSWRDLPLLINQWANVVRWEMRTRLFLRTSEFLWQEGHTAHATATEAQREALTMLEVYRRLAEDWLALPVLVGEKSEAERFAGAVRTYCIEALMRDGKALQAGTSHFLGQNFAKAFEIKFQSQGGGLEYVWQTSWGASTRLIGAIILGHGDEKGLMLPPKVAPIQVVIVPIYKTDEEKSKIIQACRKLVEQVKNTRWSAGDYSANIRIKIDEREQFTPGWKFNHWEQKGVPIRLNLGPKDIDKGVVEIIRRDTGEKMRDVPQASLAEDLPKLLEAVHNGLYQRALKYRQENTHQVGNYAEFQKVIDEKGGFIEANWCGKGECEAQIKADTKATIRAMLFNDSDSNSGAAGGGASGAGAVGASGVAGARVTGNCIRCDSNAARRAFFARAY